MADHWHGLIEPGEHGGLSMVMNRLTSITNKQRHPGQAISTWASGFHDHAVPYAENIRTAAGYVVANPLRAGLVGNVGDFPYWHCVWL